MAFTNPSITFGSTGLEGESSNNPTAIDTSKTGAPVLYVTQQNGDIYRYEIAREPDSNGDGVDEFVVTDTTLIDVLSLIQNYNDDGSINNTEQRQVTGLVVTKDEFGNDVLYVSSSDWRIAVGTDSGLDTNSGQIHKIVVDPDGNVLSSVAILRGLPRSEENHSTNGLDISIDPVTGDEILWIAQGGNTNKGAPGNNFSGTVDFALSGTILKVNLTELESYDTRIDANGNAYILDLPTLDDPTRENVDLVNDLGLDPNDIPENFTLDVNPGGSPDYAGGNNGLNQAKITEKVLVSIDGELTFVDNPLAVHSPGFRNQYDVLVTQDNEVFTWDNGPNGGWGGQPLSFSDGQIVNDWTGEFATNQFNESGSDGYGDQLHYLGNTTDTYGPYGGDANPIRASHEAIQAAFNPDGTYAGATANDPIIVDGVQLFANEAEARAYLSSLLIIYEEQGDGNWVDVTGETGLPPDFFDVVSGYLWSHPGSSLSDPTGYYDGTSVMDGTAYSPESQLLNNNNDGSLKTVNASTNGLAEYTATFFGGALDGAIIAASFDGNLYFEKPIDTDGDGRTDAVQSLGTIGGFGSQPLGVTALGDDGFSSDVLIDADGDGVDDFAGLIFAATYGANNITVFVPGGEPADPSTDLDLDGVNNTLDSHVGDPDNGLGVRVAADGSALWHFELNNPATTPPGAIPGGNSIAGDIGINAVWRNGIDPQVAEPGEPALYDPGVWNLGGASTVVSIDVADAGSAEGTANDQGDVLGIGFAVQNNVGSISIVTEGKNIFEYSLNESKTWTGGEKYGLVVGPGNQSTFVQAAVAVRDIGGTPTFGIELLVEENDVNTSLFVEIPGIEAPTRLGLGDPNMQVAIDIDLTPGAATAVAKARYVDNGNYTDWVETGAIAIPADVVSAIRGTYQNGVQTTGAFVGLLATTVAGDDSFGADWDFVEITGAPLNYTEGEILYRWNGGGGDIAAIDGGPDWLQGSATITGTASPSTQNGATNGLDASVPAATTPVGLYTDELYGSAAGDPFGLEFGNGTLAAGYYAVRLFMANGYSGTSAVGQRVFDVTVEDSLFLDDLDLVATFGHQVGGMFEWIGYVDDGTIDIDFGHVVENPLINAVEIIALETTPAGPAISVVPEAVAEGDAGATTVLITVQASEVIPSDETVFFDLEIRGAASGATPEVDFTVPGGSYNAVTGVYTLSGSIAGNSADFTFAIDVIGDTDAEFNEDIEVALVSVSGADAYVGTPVTRVTIVDDDGPVPGVVLYRVNAGGPEVAATDGGPAWSADTDAANSPYLVNPGSNNDYPSDGVATGPIDLSGVTDYGAPEAVFGIERWDAATDAAGEMAYAFDVPVGTLVEVRLLLAENFQDLGDTDTSGDPTGDRVFSVSVDGTVPAVFENIDQYALAGGFNTAVILSHTVVSDGTINLEFLHGIENPAIKGIEIVAVGGTPISFASIGAPAPAEVEETGDTGFTSLVFPVTFDTPPSQYVEIQYSVSINGIVTNGLTQSFATGDGEITVSVPNDALDNGDEAVTVTLTGVLSGPAFIDTASASATVTEDDEAAVVLAVNVGGPALLQDGIQFEGDNYFDNGNTFTDGNGGSPDQPVFDGTVFETERYGGAPGTDPLSFSLPVAPGEYTIELYFAEIFQDPNAIGERVFNVYVEGQLVLENFDILAATGGDINQPVVIELPDTFSPDQFDELDKLDITLDASVDNAKLSAIVVREAPQPTGGAATLSVTVGANDVQASNYGSNSFVLSNVGTKKIVQIDIDVTNALYPDSVFDPFGLAGDLVSKPLTIDTNGGTGVTAPSAASYIGAGGIDGFEGLRLVFDTGVNGGFEAGETIGFSVDMDPNSIAGADKGILDSGANPTWDIGGISGAELIGATFTITFEDGTTATGQLHGADNQAGSKGLASQDSPELAVTLEVNGLGAGGVGTYADGGPTVTVQGEAGQVARIVLTKGIIQPYDNNFPDGAYHDQLDAQLAAVAASNFPANNAAEFQTVDILLDGTVQDISGLFDFTQVPGYVLPTDESQLPLGFVAAVIDPANDDLPLGPVTAPVYLTYSENSAPVIGPIAPIEITEGGAASFDIVATDAEGDTITLSVEVVDNADGSVVDPASYSFTDNGDGTGSFSWTTGEPDDGTYAISVSASDGVSTSTQVVPVVVNEDVPPQPGDVLYRVNAGGGEVAATDGGPAWSADTQGANSPYLVNPGSNNSYSPGIAVNIDALAGTGMAAAVMETERYDLATDANGEMAYAFDVAAGTVVELRIYVAELFLNLPEFDNDGTPAGDRVFDVSVDGVVPLEFAGIDPYALGGNAFAVGAMLSYTFVSDGTVDVSFLHGVENPAVKAIELIVGGAADEDGPTGALSAPDVSAPGTAYQFEVTFSDATGVDVSTLDSLDVTVSNGVSGFSTTATLVSVDIPADGSPRTATYEITPPGGSWDPDDNGIYEIALVDGEVADLLGNTATGGTLGSFTVDVAPNDQVEGGALLVQVTPGSGLDASTFSGGSFILTNQSAAGVQIASVSFNLATAILPEVVFDPTGAGGDATASPFTPSSGAAATGLVVPGNPASDPFSAPHNGGFDVLTINFTDFDPGEVFTFTTDIDPNNIQNVPGAGNAGSISGYELIGATVTVTFTDGTNTEVSLASLFDESVVTGGAGSLGGSAGLITTADAVAAPVLSIVGASGDAVPSLIGDQVELTSNDFVLQVTGTPNGTVELLQADTRLYIASGDAPFDVTQAELPYHSNEAMSGKLLTTVTLDATGTALVPLSLLRTLSGNGTPDGGVNAIMAVAVDASGEISATSVPLMVRLDTPLVFDEPGIAEFNGTSATVIELPHDAAYEIPAGTIAFSFTAADTSGAQGLFVKDASNYAGGGNHFALYLNGSTLIARFQDGSATATLDFAGIVAGQEYEIAVTFGPDGSGLWVNGNLVDSDPLVMDWTQNVEYMQWGGRGWGSASGAPGFDAPFEGVIADRQIYGGVLDAAKIAALASTSSAGNGAPVAVDDAITTSEDQPVNFDPLVNDSDPDGDSLSVAAIQSQPSNGTAVLEANGTVTYTPDPDFFGSDSFEVSISDGLGGVTTSVVAVTVDPVNDAPVANDDSANTIAGQAVEIDVLANDTDVDGDVLDILSSTNGSNGTTQIVDGKVTYTPNGGFIGTDSFTYIAEDPSGETSEATVEVIVLAEPNIDPVAADDSATVAEDGFVTFQPGDNDTDANGDTVVASAIAIAASHGTAAVNPDGTVTYTPDANYFGADSFDVTVTDGQGGFDTSTVTIDVTPVDDAPVANDDSASTSSGQAVVIDLLGNDTDVDGDTLTITGLTTPGQGVLTDNGNGTVTYTPNAGASGQDTFGYTMSDGTSSDSATVTVDIQSFPAAVYEVLGDTVFNGTNGTVVQLPHDPIYETSAGTIAFTFEAADTNGAQGLFVKDASGYAGGGNHFALYLNGSSLVARFQDGSSQSVVTIGGIVAGESYDVAVTFGPDGGKIFLNGAEVGSTALVMDWNQNVEYIQWGGRGWGSASGAPGFDAPFEGVISDRRFFDVALSEDQLEQLFADGPLNGDPTAIDDVLVVAEDGSGSLFPTDNDSDPEGDALSVAAVVSGPAHGVASIGAGGEVTYTPDADYFGTDSFVLRIEDALGGFDTSVVEVEVTPEPDAPVAVNDSATTQADTAAVIDVLANDSDPDGDTLSVDSLGTATNGSVGLNPDGTVTYTPNAGFTGTDSFDYTVADGTGGFDTATVSVNVTAGAVLPAPVFAQAGVATYSGSSGDVDQYAHQAALAIPEGTIAFSFIADNPGARGGLVVKDASGYVGGGNHFAAYLDGGDLRFRLQNGSSDQVFIFDDIVAGTEYEVAVTFGAGGVAAYVDGASIGANPAFVMDWTLNQEALQVGGLGWGSATGAFGFTNPFDGAIADVEIFDEALDTDQIALLAANSSFDLLT